VKEVGRMMRSEWLLPGVLETSYDGDFYRKHLMDLGCAEVVCDYRGVYPPYIAKGLNKYTARFDGTIVARLLGWHFMLRGRKI
jgi:hypothetical protein